MTLRETALLYAELGWYVLPLTPGSKVPIRALTPRGHLDASCDPAIVSRWWTQVPDANIAISLAPSGLTVLDVDVKAGKGGAESLDLLVEELGGLPDTLQVRTPSGGLHYYFLSKENNKRRLINFRPGLDLLANGYAVAAPSVIDGNSYEVLRAVDSLPPVPEALAEVLQTRARLIISPNEKIEYPPPTPALLSHLMSLLEELGPAIQGQGGDERTYRAACLLHVDYGLSGDESLDLLRVWNRTCQPPWDESELEYKIASAGRNATGVHGRARDAWELFGRMTRTVSASRLTMPELPTQGTGLGYGGPLLDYLGADEEEGGDDWLIAGVLGAGVPQIIGGPPKVHKTFLLESMTIALTSGRPWLGRFAVPRRARVLILPREDSLRETRRRYWRLARGTDIEPTELEGWLRIDSLKPFRFDSAEDVAAMAATIEDWRPDLIAVDSLARTHAGDENSTGDMHPVTSVWGEICQRYGVAFVLVHHFNKWGQGPLLSRLRGTSDIGATARHVVGVTRLDDGGGTLLEFDGNLHPPAESCVVDLVDGENDAGKKVIRVEYRGAAKDVKSDNVDRAILTALAASEPNGLTRMELAGQVGGNPTQVTARRMALERAGKILCLGGARGGKLHLAPGT